MTDKEQSQKAKVFAEYWKNKGYEKAFSAIKYNKIRKNPIRTILSLLEFSQNDISFQ